MEGHRQPLIAAGGPVRGTDSRLGWLGFARKSISRKPNGKGEKCVKPNAMRQLVSPLLSPVSLHLPHMGLRLSTTWAPLAGRSVKATPSTLLVRFRDPAPSPSAGSTPSATAAR